MALRLEPPAEAFSKIFFSMFRLLSLSSEKLCQDGRSAGISEFLIQLPQAYWKKSTQGSILLSILPMLKPGPGLAEDADCEKPRALSNRKASRTRNRRMRILL